MNINIDLDDKRLSRQQKDQLNRLMPQKKAQDLKVGAIKEQMQLIGDNYVHSGFAIDQMTKSKTADGYVLKLMGCSIHYTDKEEPLEFLTMQREQMGDQITTLKRNLQHEINQQKELDNKFIDIYEKLNNTKVKRVKDEKKFYIEEQNKSDKEFKSVEKQLEKDVDEIRRT